MHDRAREFRIAGLDRLHQLAVMGGTQESQGVEIMKFISCQTPRRIAEVKLFKQRSNLAMIVRDLYLCGERRMKISGAIALVTGANRGLGLRFVEALVEFGAAKIYATARNIDTLMSLVERYPDLIIPLSLDVTQQVQVDAAADAAADVTLLLNNAGALDQRGLMEAADLSGFEQEMAVNVFGLARMCRAFAPIITANGGGAITNMLSVVSLTNFPPFGTYAATKAAAMSLTECLRFETRDKSIEVFGIYAGLIDTDMTDNIVGDKASAREIARNTMLGMEAGDINIDADDRAKTVRPGLRNDPEGFTKEYWVRAAEFRVNHPLS